MIKQIKTKYNSVLWNFNKSCFEIKNRNERKLMNKPGVILKIDCSKFPKKSQIFNYYLFSTGILL